MGTVIIECDRFWVDLLMCDDDFYVSIGSVCAIVFFLHEFVDSESYLAVDHC